jgi:hypothetical protein
MLQSRTVSRPPMLPGVSERPVRFITTPHHEYNAFRPVEIEEKSGFMSERN